ncbi:hypothetical protein DFS34DRAFT_654462 [Phlyctochytrium arcticum]|nr:hypothetical protein DFS34DRAFT_654462 [Phlyctochytrium arcticum]
MKAAFLSTLLMATLAFAAPPTPPTSDLHCTGPCQQGDDNSLMKNVRLHKEAAWEDCTGDSLVCQYHGPLSMSGTGSNLAAAKVFPRSGPAKCVNGKAGEYPCKDVDLLSFTPNAELGSKGNGNDIWGWVDPESQKEIAIVGNTDGSTFVDVTDPANPLIYGRLPSNVNQQVSWRDMKVYKDHVYISADDNQNKHGIQVFDLRTLRTLTPVKPGQTPPTLTALKTYREVGSTHNVVINEDSGFAYFVGSKTCRGGLHMTDIRDPANPKFVGCADTDGYTHDAQVVNYKGPDSRYKGAEIAMASNEDTLTVWDVSNKSNVTQVSRTTYKGAAYTHQGWFTEDQAYFLVDDELDEKNAKAGSKQTKTYIWDVRDLKKPVHIGTYSAAVESIDHNLYVKGNYAYLANYGSGLRILDITNVAKAELKEHAFFDVTPERNVAEFEGSWSNYPYFPSGNVIVQSIERGFFVVRPTTIPAAVKKC